MIFNGTQIQFNIKWTRRFALAMSILYLANPLYQPLNFVFHEVLDVFESPNKIMGHATHLNDDSTFKLNSHDHKVMDLESGHNIIDFIVQIFESSNEESSDETLQKRVKIDKHIASYKYNPPPFQKTVFSHAFWLLEQKCNKGHPIESKEPPRLT